MGEVIKESNVALENEVVKPSWATKKNVVGPAFGSATDDPCVCDQAPDQKVPNFPMPTYTLRSNT